MLSIRKFYALYFFTHDLMIPIRRKYWQRTLYFINELEMADSLSSGKTNYHDRRAKFSLSHAWTYRWHNAPAHVLSHISLLLLIGEMKISKKRMKKISCRIWEAYFQNRWFWRCFAKSQIKIRDSSTQCRPPKSKKSV